MAASVHRSSLVCSSLQLSLSENALDFKDVRFDSPITCRFKLQNTAKACKVLALATSDLALCLLASAQVAVEYSFRWQRALNDSTGASGSR